MNGITVNKSVKFTVKDGVDIKLAEFLGIIKTHAENLVNQGFPENLTVSVRRSWANNIDVGITGSRSETQEEKEVRIGELKSIIEQSKRKRQEHLERAQKDIDLLDADLAALEAQL